MSTEELKEYLGIIVDMEKSIYLQKNLLTDIGYKIEKLKVPKIISDPAEPHMPKYPVEPKYSKPHSAVGIGCCSVFLFYCVCAVGFVVARTLEFEVLVIVFPLIIPALWLFRCLSQNKKSKEEYYLGLDQIKQNYQISMEQYHTQMANHHAIIIENQHKRQQDEADRNAKVIFLQNQQKEVEKGLAESESRLQRIYEKNIIFPKYRNLVMVCSLYEYICAGRCTELEGHEGAYNILEAEIRLDRIISQLDLVVTNLEQIKRNQFMLYSAVQESNQRLNQIAGAIGDMSASLDGIYSSTFQINENAAQLNAHITELQKNSALTAYHAERAQKELAYMNRMDYLSGRNDDVFFNHPPV